ncbi:DgyrCDS7304 [Dimorphilus gyrociliatus]|uniref:DgyrCDS7304 n=1 Tax=Dimorphilus gyrociliatus TaxID=2664684 RepID=A0A7I8VSB6_9ANNE|nr:DgyrCDS7304 [Dimorphilus gyrociliatus]
MGSDEEISQNVNKLSEVIHALNIASTGLDLLSLKWSQQPLKGRLSIPINLDPVSWKRASKKVRSAIDELRIKDTSSFTSVENLNLNNAMREPNTEVLQTWRFVDEIPMKHRIHALVATEGGDILTAKCVKKHCLDTSDQIHHEKDLCEHDLAEFKKKIFIARSADPEGTILETDFSKIGIPIVKHRNLFSGRYPHIATTASTGKLVVASTSEVLIFNTENWMKEKTITAPIRRTGHVVCKGDEFIFVGDPETRQIHQFSIETGILIATWNLKNCPGAMCVDRNGNILVADNKDACIIQLESNGKSRIVINEKTASLNGIKGLAAYDTFVYVLLETEKNDRIKLLTEC